MENSVDPVHTYYLHAHALALKGQAARAAYFYRPIEGLHFEIVSHPAWCGVLKQRTYGGENAEAESGHPLIFPNILLAPQRASLVLHFRLPVDDTHTQVFLHAFTPNETGAEEPQPESLVAEYMQSVLNEKGDYHLDTFYSQDAMAWESQGAVTDRRRENLGTSDAGVALYRRLLRAQIGAVAAGRDPEGVVRDAALDVPIAITVSGGQAAMAKEMTRG